MAPSLWSLATAALGFASIANALLPDGRMNANKMKPPAVPVPSVLKDGPVVSRNGTQLPPYNTTYYFEQLIDHDNPSLGTFQQRYWFTYEFYEPGGPIILMTPGEANAAPYTGYLTNATINGLIAQQQNGSTIVIEHRYYGLSNPYSDLSTASLKYHTIQQAIDDLVYFANNADLPMPGGNSVTPDKAPWILIGGSYSGALTSWTLVNQPETFFAGYASSAVVEAILDYWGYFEPIRQNMPANCSADVEAVIAHVDSVFSSSNTAAINALKANWGLSAMTHLDDVAGALRNNLWDWQSLQPDSGYPTTFTQFCDALEVKNGVSAPASGWGLDHALTAWGSFWNTTYYSFLCGDTDAVTCLGTYDYTQSWYTSTAIDNADRSWEWIVCNQVGFLQDGAPEGHPTLVTRLVQPIYDERQCEHMFAGAWSSPPQINVNPVNSAYQGWNVNHDRLFFANGVRDPWREATVSADGVDRASTATQPIAIGDGFHCSDLLVGNTIDATIEAVQKTALAAMANWLATEWKPQAKKNFKRQSPEAFTPSASTKLVKPVNAWFRSFGTG